MIKTRLTDRRVTKTVDVTLRSYTTGSYSSSTVYDDITATYEQKANDGEVELMDEQGNFIQTIDIFWFEPISGTLPAITPKHNIIEGSNVYRVERVADQGGMGENLKVICSKVEHRG